MNKNEVMEYIKSQLLSDWIYDVYYDDWEGEYRIRIVDKVE
jgi:hypothetical protein